MTEVNPSASGERSAAVRDNRGVVATGDGTHVVLPPPAAVRPALSADEVRRLNNLRAPDSPVFEGREDALAQLAALPSRGTGIVSQNVQGMGGVGKTTLVPHHAHRHLAAGGGPVWWITADSPESIVNGFAALTSALQPARDPLPLDDAAWWALSWLQGRTCWLVVLDNVEDPAHLQPYLGALGTGQVLVTTRRDPSWQGLGTTLRLDTLTPAASLAVLREITGYRDDTHTADLTALAEELSHLPLALQQAGAYVERTRTPVAAYLDRLRQDPGGVLATTPPGDPHHRTVAQVWAVTLTAVREVEPHAAELLTLLAHYAPDPLPRRVLAPALATPNAVDRALGVLAAYSMITLTETTVTVHRLVQSVLRASATPPPSPPPEPRRRISRLLRRAQRPAVPRQTTTALTLLYEALPQGKPSEVSAWPIWQELLPHVEAVLTHCRETEDSLTLGVVMGKAAIYLSARGQAGAALPLKQRALEIAETTLGPQHPDTGVRLNNLATTLGELGRHTEALPLQQRALQIAEAALGPDHPTTAAFRNNLTYLRERIADPETSNET